MNTYLIRKLTIVAGLVLILQGAHAASEKAFLTNSYWVAEIDAPFYPKRTEFYVQNGKLEKDLGIRDRNDPFCVVESLKGRSQKLTIKAGSRFEIVKVFYQESAFDTTTFIYSTSMQVKSAVYPSVKKIECRVWGGQTDSYLSLEDIQKTMAGVFRIEQK